MNEHKWGERLQKKIERFQVFHHFGISQVVIRQEKNQMNKFTVHLAARESTISYAIIATFARFNFETKIWLATRSEQAENGPSRRPAQGSKE